MYILGISDIVVILSDINLASKSHLLSIDVSLPATNGTETTALEIRVLETQA